MVDISNKLIDLLKKLARADKIVSTNLENMDLAKELLVPKWKVWLLVRIFGEGGNTFVEDDSILLLDQVDESFRWEELSTETRLAGYGDNANIICSLLNDKRIKEEVGNLDDIIDDIRRYIPGRNTILKTSSFNHDKCIVESEIICKRDDKKLFTINIGAYGKTVIHYCNKVAFPSRGLNEGIYGPNPHRVPISELTCEILKSIGVIGETLDDDKMIQNNLKRKEKIEMDNLLEKKFTNFFEKEEERMKNLFTSCDKLLNMAPFDEVNKLFETSLQKLNERVDFLNNFKKGLESKKEEKEEQAEKPPET